MPNTGPDHGGRFPAPLQDADEVEQLSAAIDEVQEEAWSKLPRRVRCRRARGELALVDLDGHVKPLYGEHKEGADFSYDGRWSYQPLVVSLAGSGECLRVVNQPGSARSSEAAAGALRAVLPRVKRHFQNALVRGTPTSIGPSLAGGDRAGSLLRHWRARVCQPRGTGAGAARECLAAVHPARSAPRQRTGRRWRTANWRKHQAAQRGFRNLRTIGQWITELSYQPTGVSGPCRMIVRRIRIEEQDRQGALFESFRYRLILTNLPRSYTPREIVDMAYQRCDQENVIEQFGAGIAGWRMPVAEFMGNWAWLQIARLAGIWANGSRNWHCPRKWCVGSGSASGTISFTLPPRC